MEKLSRWSNKQIFRNTHERSIPDVAPNVCWLNDCETVPEAGGGGGGTKGWSVFTPDDSCLSCRSCAWTWSNVPELMIMPDVPCGSSFGDGAISCSKLRQEQGKKMKRYSKYNFWILSLSHEHIHTHTNIRFGWWRLLAIGLYLLHCCNNSQNSSSCCSKGFWISSTASLLSEKYKYCKRLDKVTSDPPLV